MAHFSDWCNFLKKTLEYVIIKLNITFYRTGSVRSRDIDISVLIGSRFFKPEVDTSTHTRIYFLESDDRADYRR